jgi:hypothetical protein
VIRGGTETPSFVVNKKMFDIFVFINIVKPAKIVTYPQLSPLLSHPPPLAFLAHLAKVNVSFCHHLVSVFR